MSSTSKWAEYKNSEGRTYWSHSVTKQSVWEKPEDLRTPFEKALSKTPWKQYTSKDRPYYVNSQTKETKWDLPPELVELKEKIEKEEIYKKEKERRKAAGEPSPSPPRSASPEDALDRYGDSRPRSESPIESEEELEVITMPPGGFLTHEKAEEGFTYLLKREGIDETWTWDQAMRKIVLDPLYKAFDTLAQKKEAFEKYTYGIVAKREAAREARIARLRPILLKMFSSTPEIKSYSTMKTADQLFRRDRSWREARPDERRMILDEYTTDLKRKEETNEREFRSRNIQSLGSLIRELNINVGTSWRAAHNIILGSDAFKQDRDLQEIETIDILGVYDDYARQLEQEHEEESRRLRIETTRKARKAREDFKLLLKELEGKGQLTRKSKWKDTYKLIRDDDRYLALLGPQGSSPLDLWMDAVDDLSEDTEQAFEKIDRALRGEKKEVKLETSWEEFEAIVKNAHADAHIEEKMRRDVYDLIHERLRQVAADEARRAERKKRHRIDDLRYALKKVSRHIDPDMTYEEAEPHMKDLQEYKDIEDEEDRKVAFDKFIQRQKEKLREAEASERGSIRSTSRRDSRMDVDEPERHRDKERRGRHRDESREDDKDRKDRGSKRKDDRDEKRRDDKDRSERRRDDGQKNDRDRRDRDKDRREDRDRERRSSRRDREDEKDDRKPRTDKDRKEQKRDASEDNRDTKRLRLSSEEARSKKPDDVEEGEI